MSLARGVVQLPWWGYVVYTLVLTHLTIVAVTVFLHRAQAHRALSLHPVLSHLFRFWLWLTTGMVTREWVAVHRKHHAHVETPHDPHSPKTYGLRKVLLEGAELYAKEADDPATARQYGAGAPDDWLEQHLYGEHQILGVALMLVVDLVLFGVIGMTIWAVQMAWIPFFAAGVINGVGHHTGYRNFATEDASRNIVPWGILIGGEELHNNHHAYGSSACFSCRWYELDLGWLYIKILTGLRLATVHRLVPRLRIVAGKRDCDVHTVQAVLTHRFHVIAQFSRAAANALHPELRALRLPGGGDARSHFMHYLQVDAKDLAAEERLKLEHILTSSRTMATAYSMGQTLRSFWAASDLSSEQLAQQMQHWCVHAEQCGIAAIERFSVRLRGYALRA